VKSHGDEFVEIAERLHGTGTDLNDFVHFTDADFDELGVDKETVRNTLKGLVKRVVCEIGIQSKEKVDCQTWTAETVRDYVLQFGDFCQGLAEALYKYGVTGYGLCLTSPERILEEYAEHFTEEVGGKKVAISGLRRRNVLRKLRQLYQQPEEEAVAAADDDITGGGALPSHNRAVKILPREDAGRKCAAIFSVFKNRKERAAVNEAWELEKELESSAGYGIWLCAGRDSLESPPSSTSLNDIRGFNAWFEERKKREDIDGIFIMLIAHGYTSAEESKPKVMLQDINDFDVEAWLTGTLAGSSFPVICCINSCRVDLDALGEQTCHELKASTLDVPQNIFLSWGSSKGELAVDGDFVQFWRYKIATDFTEKRIELVAAEVLSGCRGGKNYCGLDPRQGACINGIWEQKGHLGPSIITPQQTQALIKRCIVFARRAFRKSIENNAEFENEENWVSVGSLQGKKVAVLVGNSIAVLCSDDQKRVVHGLAWNECSGESLQPLIDRVNQIQVTDGTAKSFRSIEKFLATTEKYDEENIESSTVKKEWLGGRFWRRKG